MQQTASSAPSWRFSNFLASGINWQRDVVILQFADVCINFRNFDITPTRLVMWVVNLSCSSTEMPSSFSCSFFTFSLLSILTFNSLFFYFGPKLMVWYLEKLPFKKFLSYNWDTLFLSSFKLCSTSLIVSAACVNFIDGRQRTWIMHSFSPSNANHSIRVAQRAITQDEKMDLHKLAPCKYVANM